MSCDVIDHVAIRFPISRFLLVVLWNQASISNGSEIFSGECDAMIDITKVEVIEFSLV